MKAGHRHLFNRVWAPPRTRRAHTGIVVLLACLPILGIGASSAGAAVPSILNTATGCNSSVNQTNWLLSCASQGHDGVGGSGRRTRIAALVSHDPDKSITNLLTDEWTNATVTRGVSCQRPTIQGGYGRSRCNLTFTHNSNNTGLSGSTLGSCGTDSNRRYSDDRVLGVRAQDSAGQNSAISNSIEKFVAANHSTGCTEPGDIYEWSGIGTNSGTYGNCSAPSGDQFNQNIVPGTELTFCYKGQYSGGNEKFNGIRWRLRNLRDGTKIPASGGTVSCPGGDNNQKGLRVTFPKRGAWVVEAETLYGGGTGAGDCPNTKQAGFWFPIGAVNVNSAAAPTFDLNASRPQWNGNTTVTASNFDDPDDADGGGVQIIEWDLDGDTTNGVNGFEATPSVATTGNSPSFTTAQSKTVSTAGKSPGLYTVRVRVTDNGAMDAADSIRRTRIVSTTYLVDSAPAADAQSLATKSDTSLPITLTGSDPDGDSLTYSIVSGPSQGTLTGSGVNRTYEPSGTFAGTDSFVFRVNDGFGRTNDATVTVRVDPHTRITSSPGTLSGPSAQFEFDSPVTSSSFECQLDEGDWEACESPQAYSGLEEGSHSFGVRATAGGNTDPSPATHTWNVTTTPPGTSITAQPDDPTRETSAAFEFEATKEGSTFECRLDEGDWEACESGKDYSDLEEGSHTFEVKATDSVGNVGSPAAVSWFVDRTAPAASISAQPDDPTNQGSASFEFEGSDNHTDAADLVFECKIDDGDWEACVSGQGYDDLAEGSHTFQVRATDEAHNTGDAATYSWFVDQAPPATSIGAHPHGLTNETSASFEFEGSDNHSDASDLGFECKLDDGDWAACASGQSYSDLEEGSHTFQVRATDQAHNIGDPATYSWFVDRTAPDATITAHPADPTSETSASFEFDGSDNHSESADLGFECKLDGGDWEACVSGQSYSDLEEGSHTFQVRATDEAHNTGDSATYSWSVDRTAPDATITAHPDEVTNQASASFEFEASKNGSTFECKLDEGDWEPCESGKGYSNLGEGSHTFQVRATDAAHNTGEAAAYSWSVDRTPPSTSISAHPDELTNQSSASFEFEASKDGSTFECKLDEGDWEPCESGKGYSNLGEGSHTFQVRATDQVHNTGDAATYSWFVDRTPPATSISAHPDDPTNQTGAGFEFAGSDNHSGAADLRFECRLDGGDWEACISGKQYADLGDGSHTFEVRATDEAHNTGDPATYSWLVNSKLRMGTFACRASAVRAGSSEPFVANGDGKTCASEENGAGRTLSLPGLLTLRGLDATSTQAPEDPELAAAEGEGARAEAGAGEVTVAGLFRVRGVAARAEAICRNGSPVLSSSSEIGGLTLEGLGLLKPPVTVPVGGAPMDIPLGLATLHLNARIQRDGSITQRALWLEGGPGGDVIVGEATAGTEGNPCAPS